MEMKIICPKCKTEYLVNIEMKRIYCGHCDIEYLVTAVDISAYPNGTVYVDSKYKSINSEYNFDCKTRNIIY